MEILQSTFTVDFRNVVMYPYVTQDRVMVEYLGGF